MTPQLQAMFKKSLKSNRWSHYNAGAPENYTHENMVARWFEEKNKWLHVRHTIPTHTLKSEQCDDFPFHFC